MLIITENIWSRARNTHASQNRKHVLTKPEIETKTKHEVDKREA